MRRGNLSDTKKITSQGEKSQGIEDVTFEFPEEKITGLDIDIRKSVKKTITRKWRFKRLRIMALKERGLVRYQKNLHHNEHKLRK